MKKSILMVWLGVIATLGLTGCGSANGPQFTKFDKPKEGKSLLYIYRGTSILGGGLSPNIHKTDLNASKDEIIGELVLSSYIKTELDVGKKYQIWAKTEAKNEVDIDAKANEIYCVENYFSVGIVIHHPQFKIWPLETCTAEIQKTKLNITEDIK